MLVIIERHARFLLVLCVAGIVVACLYPFNFINRNHVSGAPLKGVEFADPSIARSADVVAKLAGVDRFTLSLRIMPRFTPFNRRIGQIIGSGLNDARSNFAIRQKRKDLCVMLGADSGDVPGCRLLIRDIFRKPEALWIDIVYDGRVLRSYVNGVARDSASYAKPGRWSGSYPLVAGNSADQRYAWSGRIDSLVLFSEALPPGGRSGGWRTGEWGRPLLLYTDLDGEGTVIPDGGTGGSADLIVPGYYPQHRRAVYASFPYYRPFDIVVNIAGFIPLGFLCALALRRSPLTGTARTILVVGFGIALSLALEFLQAYLPTRTSGIADVVSNSLGTIPGYLLCLALCKKASR